jgi:hypothetical protein
MHLCSVLHARLVEEGGFHATVPRIGIVRLEFGPSTDSSKHGLQARGCNQTPRSRQMPSDVGQIPGTAATPTSAEWPEMAYRPQASGPIQGATHGPRRLWQQLSRAAIPRVPTAHAQACVWCLSPSPCFIHPSLRRPCAATGSVPGCTAYTALSNPPLSKPTPKSSKCWMAGCIEPPTLSSICAAGGPMLQRSALPCLQLLLVWGSS